MNFSVTVKEIELDENVTREQLVQELVRNFVNSENARDLIRCKDELIMELKNRIDDKNTIIWELKEYIATLEKQVSKKRK